MCLLPCLSPASDYGMKLPILRSNPEDQILYQTERYNEETFGYEVPIKEEGDYVLVLKFAEVYFAQSQQKVSSAQAPAWSLAYGCFWAVGYSEARAEACEPPQKGGTVNSEGGLVLPS